MLEARKRRERQEENILRKEVGLKCTCVGFCQDKNCLHPGKKDSNVFRQQAEAIAFRRLLVEKGAYNEDQLGIFAQEIGEGGVRRFLVDTYAGFALDNAPFDKDLEAAKKNAKTQDGNYPSKKGLPNLYEVFLEDRPCFLYFDLEFQTELNPGLTGDDAMNAFRTTLSYFVEEVIGARLDAGGMVELDSTTPAKFSKHVLVRYLRGGTSDAYAATDLCGAAQDGDDNNLLSLAFANNAQAGLFVREFVAFARRQRDNGGGEKQSCAAKLFVHVKPVAGREIAAGSHDRKEASLIDESVYSRNRCFRLLFHTKFGKQAYLKVERPGSILPKFPFCLQLLRSMASFVPSGTALFSHSLIPKGFAHAALRGTRIAAAGSGLGRSQVSAGGGTVFSQSGLVQYILDSWDKVRRSQESLPAQQRTEAARVQNIVELDDRYFTMTLSGNHFCLSKGASHKSNHIYLVVDRQSRRYWQKCFDFDCNNFQSEHFPIPELFIEASAGCGGEYEDEAEEDMFEAAAAALDAAEGGREPKRPKC